MQARFVKRLCAEQRRDEGIELGQGRFELLQLLCQVVDFRILLGQRVVRAEAFQRGRLIAVPVEIGQVPDWRYRRGEREMLQERSTGDD